LKLSLNRWTQLPPASSKGTLVPWISVQKLKRTLQGLLLSVFRNLPRLKVRPSVVGVAARHHPMRTRRRRRRRPRVPAKQKRDGSPIKLSLEQTSLLLSLGSESEAETDFTNFRCKAPSGRTCAKARGFWRKVSTPSSIWSPAQQTPRWSRLSGSWNGASKSKVLQLCLW
jgi:hypothetical protein